MGAIISGQNRWKFRSKKVFIDKAFEFSQNLTWPRECAHKSTPRAVFIRSSLICFLDVQGQTWPKVVILAVQGVHFPRKWRFLASLKKSLRSNYWRYACKTLGAVVRTHAPSFLLKSAGQICRAAHKTGKNHLKKEHAKQSLTFRWITFDLEELDKFWLRERLRRVFLHMSMSRR